MVGKSNRKGWMSIADRKTLWECPIDKIVIRREWNSRRNYGDIEGLAKSIYENGVRTPLRGYHDPELEAIVLTDGFRRMDAIRLANDMGASIERVPMLAEERKANEGERLLTQLISNDGKPLEPLEQADVIRRLINYGQSEAEISRRIGKSPGYVNKLAALAYAEPEVVQMIENGQVAATTVMQTMHEFDKPEAVKEVLSEAVSIAQQNGKTKATSSVVQGVTERRTRAQKPELTEEEIESLRKRVVSACWEQAPVRVLEKVAKLLDKEQIPY